MTLSFESLSFSYEDGPAVFDGVSFDFEETPVTWVRGGPGGGRSTVLKLLAGLLKPTAGQILVDGRDVATFDFAGALSLRLRTGYGFDHGGLLSTQSLRENLSLILNYHGLSDRPVVERRVDGLLERFGLAAVAGLRPYALTGSQRKLACVLRAFVHEPELVLLDEPLVGLKTESVAELIGLAREGLVAGWLKRLIMTGENPLLADALHARALNVSRERFVAGGER